jgi:hypothetical protein
MNKVIVLAYQIRPTGLPQAARRIEPLAAADCPVHTKKKVCDPAAQETIGKPGAIGLRWAHAAA